MHILVVNSGSSSIKFSMFETSSREPQTLYDGEISGIGTPAAHLAIHGIDHPVPSDPSAADPIAATRIILDTVSAPRMPPVEAVGYRVVHPGPKLSDHQKITPEVLHDLAEAVSFAPLHDPAVLDVIREGQKHFPEVSHYACFDTVFHLTMPEEATTYPIPKSYRDQGVRRYGFHGLSCESIVRQLRASNLPFPKRMVICHLGSGCSVTALIDGQSVDTSMGLTPTGGVVMGTRPGDLDPGLLLYLLRQQQGDRESATAAVEKLLNHDAGMIALTSMPNDVKAIREASAKGNKEATLALKVFTRSLTKAIGGFSWLLGGLDAIVFAGGIGEHDPLTRYETLACLEPLGVAINSALNQQKTNGVRAISASDCRTTVFVIPAQEDLTIAMHVDRLARSNQ
ncbi:acetate/propionate family kinase [Granulicella sibirica]|uniref:Acetate kinase n=1 Tax=Granulicella sibirica TaxID=2479048 RepID=A0A4V1L5P2_9BACT|nr:acetate/propionate family kinase [Granulicella sibirica]RXH56454.1 Acetate kinase [Granulicella sibirica]